MQPRATTVLVAAVLCLAPVASQADLSAYSQDFETLVQADGAALGNDGWKYFANVFTPAFGYLYGYGPGPAPNGGPAFSAIAAGQGGPPQGAQQLVTYSDYNNGDHANGNLIEANVFQEQVIGAADDGSVWTFEFDAKRGDIAGATTAIAFIKTLHPVNFGLTSFITLDTTALPTTWGTHQLSIAIGPGLVGHILQIGFANTTTSYTPSGVLYDNITFTRDGATPASRTSWGQLKSRYR